MRLLFIALLFANVARGQVIGVQGGVSSLFNAEGGSLTLYTQDTNDTFGIGLVNNRLVAGANSEFVFHGWETKVGDGGIFLSTQQLGLSTVLRGIQTKRKYKDSELTVFTGLVGQSYSAPFFSGVTAKRFGTGFQYSRKFDFQNNRRTACRGVGCPIRSGSLEFSTVGAYTNGRMTALEGATYHWRTLVLQGTSGLLEGRKYLIGQATQRFKHASLDAGRQTFIWQSRRSTVTSGNLAAWAGPLDGHASIFKSSLATGKNAGAGLRIGPITVRGDSFSSKGQHTLTGATMERFSRHWSLSQFYTRSNGQSSFNGGFTYTSNIVTASVGYQQAFIPFSNIPFQKVLSVTLSFQLPHGTSLNLATQAAPNSGKPRWTAYGGSYVEAPWLPSGAQQGHSGRTKIAGYEVRGKVVDAYGPIEGAAIEVGGQLVYTNAEGVWTARFKKAQAVSIRVVLEEFTAPGNWRCVECPATGTPGEPVVITVARR